MATEMTPDLDRPFGFKAQQAKKQGWMARLLRAPDSAGAVAAIESALATTPWDDLAPESVQAILKAHGVRPELVSDHLVGMYRRAVEHCVSERTPSDVDLDRLQRLAALLGLAPIAAAAEKQWILEGRYRESLQAAVADRWLSDEEKRELDDLAADLRIPADHIEAIRRDVLGKLLQDAWDRATRDHRLTPDEDAYLEKLATNVGVTLKLDESARRLADRCRTLWRLQSGELPTMDVPIRLQKGEICHWSVSATHHEFRTVTTHVRYAGPTARIRIAKGVSWRMGQIGISRGTQDVLKLLDEGTLYVTSKRLLFDGAKKTTNLPLRRILNFTVYEDGVKIEKDSGKDQYFQFTTGDAELLGAILDGTLANQ